MNCKRFRLIDNITSLAVSEGFGGLIEKMRVSSLNVALQQIL